VKVAQGAGGFRWRYPIETAEVVQVAKGVRMSSGIAAALHLADLTYTVECCALLRVVDDLAAEIIFLSEGLLRGELNAAQAKFVSDHFRPLPRDPDELEEREKESYVARRDIFKAHGRLTESSGQSAELHRRTTAYLNKVGDAYVHGGYETAMEMFTGRGMRFMMTGHESARFICVAKASVAGKLYRVVAALELMALTRRLESLIRQTRQARQDLDISGEQAGDGCPAL
jgi:hypothetical protein